MRKFNPYTFAEALVQFRLKKQVEIGRNIALRELAKEIGISACTLFRAINHNELKINSIIRICDCIGREITEFIN